MGVFSLSRNPGHFSDLGFFLCLKEWGEERVRTQMMLFTYF